jgi:hypothetical protein
MQMPSAPLRSLNTHRSQAASAPQAQTTEAKPSHPKYRTIKKHNNYLEVERPLIRTGWWFHERELSLRQLEHDTLRILE